MRRISEISLICFLWDLRRILVLFENEMPSDIDFISVESFYFYMSLASPAKSREIAALMGIVEPFIPIIISQKNLENILDAYFLGDFARLSRLEQVLIDRSKLLFINAAITADNAGWNEMVEACCDIRSQS
ncbi:MAG: hypothetical protein LBE35_02430 [Clostridiales bacterium]|jgi:hypothetical protein|nr:hypothetical protein [Clostridiales bacterium]